MARISIAVAGLLLAVVVLIWSAGTDERPADPHNDVLRTAKGTIWWVDRTCRIWQLHLPDGDRVLGGAGHCHVWPSPSGRLALASQDDPQSPRPPGRLELLAGDLHSVGVIGVRSDAVSPGVAWAPDSSEIALCITRGQQQAVEVVRVPVVLGIGVPGQQFARVVENRCHPAFMLNASLATSDGRHVYVDAKRVPIDGLLTHLAGGGPLDVHVMAIAASRGGLVIAVARRLPPGEDEQASLVTVRKDGLGILIDDPPRGLIDAMDVSPSGAWLSIEYALSGRVRMIPTNAAILPAAIPETTNGLAWSPNGLFVAVALPSELRIVNLVTGASTSLPAANPTSLAWTP